MNKYAFFLLCASAAFAQTADTVSFVNFENREVGVYGNAEAKEDFKRNTTDKRRRGAWQCVATQVPQGLRWSE